MKKEELKNEIYQLIDAGAEALGDIGLDYSVEINLENKSAIVKFTLDDDLNLFN